jgi:hypothetical protein
VWKIVNTILRMQAHTRIGDGVRAAAILYLTKDCASSPSANEMLWEMAARAGFKPPVKIAKKLARRTAAAGKAVQS